MPRPALLTQTSTCPNAPMARSRRRSTSARRVTSVTTARAPAPALAATSFSSASRRGAVATRWAGAAGGDRDPMAGGAELFGEGRADPAARAGDDDVHGGDYKVRGEATGARRVG